MSKKIVLSLIILFWLLLQVYTGFFEGPYQADTWPFTTFSMYAPKHEFGERAILLRLYGHTVSGKVVEVFTEDFGMAYWGFRRQAWDKLLNPETRESYASELVSIYNQRQKDTSQKLKDLQIVSESIEVTKNGPSDLMQEILFTYNPE